MQNDYDALVEATLVDDSDAAYKYGMISKNLKLPKTGAYDLSLIHILVETAFSYTATLGTQVKFSSEKGLVNADGTINIPGHTTADKVLSLIHI